MPIATRTPSAAGCDARYIGHRHLLLGGEIHVQQDTTPAANTKLQKEIDDAMKGQLPPAWSDALKEYYKKLGQE